VAPLDDNATDQHHVGAGFDVLAKQVADQLPNAITAARAKTRLVFAGTPEFAQAHLRALFDAGFTISLVVSQPDRRIGRGRKTAPTPVKALALELGLSVAQPQSCRDPEFLQLLEQQHSDWLIVVAYGALLPPKVLATPKHGCLNVHGSLLPRWRGAAPVQRAIEAGDQHSGVSIMQMDAGLDTGPVRCQQRLQLQAFDTSQTLLDSLVPLCTGNLIQVLDRPADFPPIAQDNSQATYAAKLLKHEKWVDWRDSAKDIERKMRALQPWPTLNAVYAGQAIKLLKSEVGKPTKPEPVGQICALQADALVIACGATGQERLHLTRLQLPGGKPVDFTQFMLGRADFFSLGQRFDASTL